MNALVKTAALPAVTTSEASASEVIAFLQMIERASKDPKVNIDKLQRLLDMRSQEWNRLAALRYREAMTACQTAMEPIRTDAINTHANNAKYATLAAVDAVARPIYTAHGFALSFDTDDCTKENHVRVVCRVHHAAGHAESFHIDMPCDGKGAKGAPMMTTTHAVASAISYARRYLLLMVFSLCIERDDDGNAAGRRQQTAPPALPQEDETVADFHTLKDELIRNSSIQALEQWGIDNKPRIERQPVERRNTMRKLFLAKLSELRTRQPADDPYPQFDAFDELPEHSAPPRNHDNLDIPGFLRR